MSSGNTLGYMDAAGFVAPSSNMATYSTRNGHLILDFDHTTAESVLGSAVLSRNYAGGGLTFTIMWLTTATSGNCVWGLSIERHDDEGTDLDSDSFAAEKTVTATAPTTGGSVQYSTIAFTSGAEMDSLAAGEHFRFKVRRVATDGGDTINSNDCSLLGVEWMET